MDLSKAKNILIVIFIALNLFMLVNIGMLQNEDDAALQVRENALTILEERGVSFMPGVEIPVFNEDLPLLVFDDMPLDRAKIATQLLSTATSGSQDYYISGTRSINFYGDYMFDYVDVNAGIQVGTTEETLLMQISSLGIPSEEFILDMKADSLVKFIQKSETYLIFDNYILFELQNGGIARISCSYRPIKGFESKETILPAYQILIKNLVECNGYVIQSIDLGYKGSGHAGGIPGGERQAPVWRVYFTNSMSSYYRTYDGKEI